MSLDQLSVTFTITTSNGWHSKLNTSRIVCHKLLHLPIKSININKKKYTENRITLIE